MLGACSSGSAPSSVPGASPTDSGGPLPATASDAPGTGSPNASAIETPAAATGHYSIDVHNLASGGKWNLPGHHEHDGNVECAGSDALGWVADATYIEGTPEFPGGDIGQFGITTTAGQQSVFIAMMVPISDNPYDWRVAESDHYGETFDFQVNEHASPMTITANARNKYETISITVTCSVVSTTP